MGHARWVCAALALSVSAASAQKRDSSYYCVAEATGGLKYNTGTKRWYGTDFLADEKFVLKLKYLSERFDSVLTTTAVDYAVTITPSGRDFAMECAGGFGDRKEPVTVYGGVNLRCAFLGAIEYLFNLKTNRYLSVYLYGYTDGRDNNDNNPGINAGVCTKID
jgi:hypothetical protein